MYFASSVCISKQTHADTNIHREVSLAPVGLVSLLAELRLTQSRAEGQRGKHTLFNSSQDGVARIGGNKSLRRT